MLTKISLELCERKRLVWQGGVKWLDEVLHGVVALVGEARELFSLVALLGAESCLGMGQD